MPLPILFIANAVVGESLLPNVELPFKFALRSEGKAALDQLDCLLNTLFWGDEEMEMIWHDDICMELVAGSVIMSQYVKHQARPSFVAEEWFSACCLG